MLDLTSLPSNRKITENTGVPSAAHPCLLQGLKLLGIISVKQCSIETKTAQVSNENEDPQSWY